MDWTDVAIAAPFVLLIGAFLFHAGGWFHRLQHVLEFGHEQSGNSIASVELTVERDSNHFHFFGSRIMVQGDALHFSVVCKNKNGNVVPATDVAVVVTGPATAVVQPDGLAGVLTAALDGSGAGTMVATAAGVTSAPFLFSVSVDSIVTSVEIVPQA